METRKTRNFRPIFISRGDTHVTVQWTHPLFLTAKRVRIPKEVWEVIVYDIGNEELVGEVIAGKLALQS